ncbi:hypothetical protein BGZ93_008642 [Podila epicladia]|nr:hypothetical protein BGZ92_009033 [Podila epicladia]KAG0091874.1 hypothetical protein BGZ93_008642 [Podila epicladia]
MSKLSQTSQSSASDFFSRGRKATTTQRIVAAKKSLVNTPLPPNARLPAPESIPTTKPNAKYRLAETSFDNDGLDDEEFHDSDFEAYDDDGDDDVQIVAVVKPVAPTVTKAKIGRTISLNPRALNSTKTKEDIPIRRAHSTGKLLEMSSTVSRKRSKSEMNTRSVSTVLESIHQEDLTDTEKALRQFDLTSKYGPCTDISRLERWERASLLGLNPPQEIKDTLLKNSAWSTNIFAGRV